MESGRGRCLFASGGQVAKMLVDLYQYPSEIRAYSNIRGGGGMKISFCGSVSIPIIEIAVLINFP